MKWNSLIFLLGLVGTATAVRLATGAPGWARTASISDRELATIRGRSDPMWCRDGTLPDKPCAGYSAQFVSGVCDSPERVYVYHEYCSSEFDNEYCLEPDFVRIHDYTATRCKWREEAVPGQPEGWYCRVDSTANPATCCQMIWTDPLLCSCTPKDAADCHSASNCAAGNVSGL